MSGSRALVLALTRRRDRQLSRAAENPASAAERAWRETWWQIEKGPFWRARMGEPGRDTPPMSAFPVTEYEDYRAALGEGLERELSPLSGDPVRYLAAARGPGGEERLFPVTDHARAQWGRAMAPLAHRLARRYRGFLRAPLLFATGATPERRAPSGVAIGPAAHELYRAAPAPLRRRDAVASPIRDDEATFAAWAPLYALATDLSAIFGASPAAVGRFLEVGLGRLDRYWPILAGRERPPEPLPPVRVSADRLHRLRRALARNPFSLREVWPSLQFVSCFLGGAWGLQAVTLERYAQSRVPIVDGIYGAAEGFVTVPDASGREGGAVHPGVHVVEFLPRGEAPAARNLRALSDLEEGGFYEVIVTTSTGLVRYRLGDVVRCRGYAGRTPIVEFAHKAGEEIALGPALLSEWELSRALLRAGVRARDRVVFRPDAGGRRAVLCHGGDAAEDDAAAVHGALAELSEGYRVGVRDGTVEPVALLRLPEDDPALGDVLRADPAPRVLSREPLHPAP